MNKLALVRAPFTYRYNGIDVREEAILSQLAHYLDEIGTVYDIFDFHLMRHLSTDAIVASAPSSVVIAVRETGDNVHYALRLAGTLARRLPVPIVLYGQTARLLGHSQLPKGVQVVGHSEAALARALGISDNGPHFERGLRIAPYIDRLPLEPWQASRRRGTLETSRGCPFPCDFCFINAGKNHERRWMRQQVEDTLRSLAAYEQSGIRAFVFHDSEFIGGSRADIAARDALVDALISEARDVYFKIYARADTILRYPRLDKLREAGLVSVFIGVESLVQTDLDRLDKRLSVETTHRAIQTLADHEIYMDLSFILFNRSTSVATLRQNLEGILRLYDGPKARFLGMPHFTFSFESTWRGAQTQPLSRQTYVDWDVRMKAPAAQGAVFDTGLEPLMELYRLLAYEWSKKVVSLNLARDSCVSSELESVERWFAGLGLFCVRAMIDLLDDFERGRLGVRSIATARDKLFARIEAYYSSLPPRLRPPATFASHAGALDYATDIALLEEDEYWLAQIPDLDGALASTTGP